VVTSVKLTRAGFTARGLRQVGDVVDDGQVAQEFRRADERGHPRAAILVVPLEVIAIKQRQRGRKVLGEWKD
jgi:hypothetical protein